MRFLIPLLVVVASPILVAAHADDSLARRRLVQRQATTTSTTSTTSTSSNSSPSASSASSSAASSGITSGSLSPNSTTTLPSVILASTNPTAVPLSGIVSFQSSSATKPLPSTPTAGSLPSISGAPPLPDVSKLQASKYPKLDVVPPTDTPEVQQWIAEVASTGIVIPSFNPTNDGGCVNNSEALQDPTRCWWTCGGCVRASVDITDCPTHMDWGLTYDDGPAFYTPNLLEYLDSQKLKSTFFVVGSRVISLPRVLQYEYMGLNQVAVHTWSHHSLTQLSNEQVIAELGWSKKVIKDVLGVTPNMMRPPYGDIDDRVRAISVAMGLRPVMWSRISPLATYDTGDFYIHGGTTSVNQVLQNWEYILGNATVTDARGFIVLEHDLFEESVEVATGYILPDALARNPPFSVKPVSACQHLDISDAYIETNNNDTNPPPLAMAVSASVFTTTSVSPSATAKGATSSSDGTGISVPVFGILLPVLASFIVPLL